ncbi:MAG: hypothetical protein GX089_15440 [Fibrobacter sp.]|nr:hypothetical protein [Fibrobacter sp.]
MKLFCSLCVYALRIRRTTLFLIMIPMVLYSDDFLSQQRNYTRFRSSETEKLKTVEKLFSDKGLSFTQSKIFLRAFKREAQLELWAAKRDSDDFVLLKTYQICQSSGDLGPKRMQGDYQVPEGLYIIDRFNPSSSFYLSLGINYPNKSDRILGVAGKLGGDIFIHGSCVTIGCLPIEDEYIKELYLICAYARNYGQKMIEVHIFPARMNEEGMKFLRNRYNVYRETIGFWENLKQFYDYFEKQHRVPVHSVAPDGKYVLKSPD